MPRFMLAILPPKDISDAVVSIQKEIELKYGAAHAQKVLPHITIIPPFDCDQEIANKFIEQLKLYLANHESLHKIHLDNFQQFDMKTLIVDVAKNVAFEKWCKGIKLFFNSQKIIKQRVEKHFFVPHITIANKDIKKRDFKLAWAEFRTRKYQAKFELLELTVLILKEGKWAEFCRIKT